MGWIQVPFKSFKETGTLIMTIHDDDDYHKDPYQYIRDIVWEHELVLAVSNHQFLIANIVGLIVGVQYLLMSVQAAVIMFIVGWFGFFSVMWITVLALMAIVETVVSVLKITGGSNDA